jgi:hypothetical protein
MIVLIELQLSKCTKLVQCDVKIWFEEHEDKYMFCGERHVVETKFIFSSLNPNLLFS